MGKKRLSRWCLGMTTLLVTRDSYLNKSDKWLPWTRGKLPYCLNYSCLDNFHSGPASNAAVLDMWVVGRTGRAQRVKELPGLGGHWKVPRSCRWIRGGEWRGHSRSVTRGLCGTGRWASCNRQRWKRKVSSGADWSSLYNHAQWAPFPFWNEGPRIMQKKLPRGQIMYSFSLRKLPLPALQKTMLFMT